MASNDNDMSGWSLRSQQYNFMVLSLRGSYCAEIAGGILMIIYTARINPAWTVFLYDRNLLLSLIRRRNRANFRNGFLAGPKQRCATVTSIIPSRITNLCAGYRVQFNSGSAKPDLLHRTRCNGDSLVKLPYRHYPASSGNQRCGIIRSIEARKDLRLSSPSQGLNAPTDSSLTSVISLLPIDWSVVFSVKFNPVEWAWKIILLLNPSGQYVVKVISGIKTFAQKVNIVASRTLLW